MVLGFIDNYTVVGYTLKYKIDVNHQSVKQS